jgi:hypothetical protein
MSEVAKQLELTNQKYAACRLRGHHWELQRRNGWLVVDRAGWLSWEYECSTCETTKKHPINPRTGEIHHASYDHPEGYLFDLDALQRKNRPTRAEVRLACIGTLTHHKPLSLVPKSGDTKGHSKQRRAA